MIAERVPGRSEFAAACLLGRPPAREVTSDDVAHWQRAQVLLPIAEALEAGGGLPAVMIEPVASARRPRWRLRGGERHAMAQVLDTLDRAAIPALVLKGAALAYTVYPKAWLRARSDIDLLVPAGSLERVGVAMRSLDLSAAREVTHPLISRQRHFHSTAGYPVALDVHDALVNPPVLRTLPGFDELHARSQAVPALGQCARALGTPDALLHALVHRVAHHNSSVDLLWLNDLRLLVERMKPRDWEIFAATATESRAAAIAADGLRTMSTVLQIQPPGEVVHRLASVRGERSAALLGGALTEWRLQWINFKSLSGPGERLAFARAQLTPPPHEVTFGSSRLPRLPFAYAARVWRGARKWLRPIGKLR